MLTGLGVFGGLRKLGLFVYAKEGFCKAFFAFIFEFMLYDFYSYSKNSTLF